MEEKQAIRTEIEQPRQSQGKKIIKQRKKNETNEATNKKIEEKDEEEKKVTKTAE